MRKGLAPLLTLPASCSVVLSATVLPLYRLAMPSLPEVREHFERAGVAKQKWPEELHEVDDFPRTASGKVQKYVVRQGLRDRSES